MMCCSESCWGGTMRSQLLCLNAYVGEDVAARATAAELTGWLDETADLIWKEVAKTFHL